MAVRKARTSSSCASKHELDESLCFHSRCIWSVRAGGRARANETQLLHGLLGKESTHKVTSIVCGECRFLWRVGALRFFMESLAPDPDFCQNPVFAVREDLHRFRTKPTPDSDSPWSKVPPAIWNLVFF